MQLWGQGRGLGGGALLGGLSALWDGLPGCAGEGHPLQGLVVVAHLPIGAAVEQEDLGRLAGCNRLPQALHRAWKASSAAWVKSMQLKRLCVVLRPAS